MVQTPIYEFTINGSVIDHEDYVLQGTSITYTKDPSEGNRANIIVSKDLLNEQEVTKGQDIIIKRGLITANKYKFRGKIYDIVEKEGGDFELICYDRLYQFKQLFFRKSYDQNIDPQAGEISAIAKDIIENGGLSASVVDTGTSNSDILLKKYNSDLDSRRNRLKVLSKIVDYIFFDDYENNWIRFEPDGFVDYPNTLEVGDNVVTIPRWRENLTTMRNKLYVDGAFQEDTREETFSGDGSTTDFKVENIPETLEVTVGGVLQKLGIEGGSTTFDYSVDKELQTIIFESGSIPASGTDNIVVKYTVLIPYTSVGQDDASISQYGIIQEEPYNFSDIRTVEDADNRLEAILDKLKNGTSGTSFETTELDLRPGMKVDFIDINNPAKNDSYIVKEVTVNYPEPVDTVRIGTDDFNITELMDNINERLKVIEGRDSISSDILRILKNLSSDLKVESRYCVIEKLAIDGTTLYWDSIEQGNWDEYDWADEDDTYDDTRKVIIQGNNKYKEFIIDEDFVDTNTGVTVNTTNNQLEFVANGEIVLGPITKNVSLTSYTLTSGTITGDLTIEISGDGKNNWQTVSLGSNDNFNNFDSGEGVYIRITETSGTSTANLSSTTDGNGKFVTPAINCFVN